MRSLGEVSAGDWDALCPPDDPFVEYAFLQALEASGSVGEGTGWLPLHGLVKKADTLIAAVPLYLKFDSYGEYIFDFGWANAAHRAGIPYYPKLVAAVPFTPVTGRRFLGDTSSKVLEAIAGGLLQTADDTGASSVHVLFMTGEEQARLTSAHPFLPRLTYQFHWENRGYASFQHYLAGFRSSVRKQIRKERRLAAESGLRLATKSGVEFSDEEWRVLELVYRHTAARKGGFAYLTPAFFPLLRERLAHRVVAAFAYDGSQPVAAALALTKGAHLYGRYWGSLVPVEALHFELCYYQLIEFAIDRGLQRFEAGAQGEHKLKRGLLPSATYSAHWLAHTGLAAAVEDFLRREREAVHEEMELLGQHSPFHKLAPG